MISYRPLWKTLIDKDIKKTQLMNMVGFSAGTLSRLSKNQYVEKKVIRFEIRPGKSIVQKIWEPVEDLFSGHGEETENKMDQWIWAEIFGAAGILILLWYGWRMKRTGKRRKKICEGNERKP